MPRSPMVPVRSDLHGSLAAARPQLRKLCALLGKEECKVCLYYRMCKVCTCVYQPPKTL
jgi:hypothetical protein